MEEMHKLYEIVIYTASLAIYADPLLDELDPYNFASFRLFREHCTFYNNAFVKDLSQLGRDLKDVIIVDNSPASYALQTENAIPILTWLDDLNDNKLYQLAPVLELLAKVHDVRPYIRKIVKEDKINYLQAFKILRFDDEHEKERGDSHGKCPPIIDSWVGSSQNHEKKLEITAKSPQTKKDSALLPKPLSQFLRPDTRQDKVKRLAPEVGPLTPQYKGTSAQQSKANVPYVSFPNGQEMCSKKSEIERKISAETPVKRPVSSADKKFSVPQAPTLLSGNDTSPQLLAKLSESTAQKKPPPHHQPRQTGNGVLMKLD